MRRTVLYSVCFASLISSYAYAAPDAANVADQRKQIPQNISSQAMPSTMLKAPAQESLPVARDGEIIDSTGSGAIEPLLPVVQTSDGISYITGGIGDEELGELKAQEHNFNVRLLISTASGEYMSDISLRFLDKRNAEIFKVDGVGPYFYANLPAGSYTVEATSAKGAVQKVRVVAPAKPSASGRISIRFKD